VKSSKDEGTFEQSISFFYDRQGREKDFTFPVDEIISEN